MTDRVLLYVIYEKDGVLDVWYECLFKEFKSIAGYLLCVVNGDLNDNSKRILSSYFNKIIYRKNVGYDVTAYKEGILYLLENNVSGKEFVICNNSFFAPLYPLDKMFNIMSNQPCDFWGITDVKGSKKIPYHIQSYFYVFREKVFFSEYFMNFFKNLGNIKDYNDAVSKVELVLTEYLINNGFTPSTYMDIIVKSNYNNDQLALIKNGCPVLKKRKLVYSKRYGFNHGINNIGLLKFIKDNTSFNVENIYNSLLKEFPFDQLDYCLNSNIVFREHNNIKTIYNKNKTKYVISYNKRSADLVEKLRNKYSIENVEYIETNSFIQILDIIKNSNNDMFAHAGLIYRDFLSDEINFILMEHLFLSVIGDEKYRLSVDDYFFSNKNCGMLIPMDFVHGIKFNTIFNEKDVSYDIIKNSSLVVPKVKGIDILGLSSSFIINDRVKVALNKVNYMPLGNEYLSYIYGGRLLRYLCQSELCMSYKVANEENACNLISNLSYKHNNFKLEDILKSWWLTRKLKKFFRSK